MVGKANSCIGGTALANYVMQDVKGYELFRNGVVGETPTEVLHHMRVIQDLNQRAIKKTFSFVLSPEKVEGTTLSDQELKVITKDFLKEMNLNPEERQFVAFVHDEKEHKHIHIIMNRVGYDGKLLPDNYIGKKSQWAAHRTAKKHGLKSAKEIAQKNEKNRAKEAEIQKQLRNEIYRKHKWVMSKKPASVQVYIKMMGKMDVLVEPTIRKYGEIKGMRIIDLKTGGDFKASEVHRSMSLPNIMKTGIPYDTPKDIVDTALSDKSQYIDMTPLERTDIYEDLTASIFENTLQIVNQAIQNANYSENQSPENRKKKKKTENNKRRLRR